MRGKEPIYKIINTLAASGDNVKDDTVAEQVVICVLDSADPLVQIADPIPYGRTKSVDYYASAAEVRQIAVIGAEVTKETVVASTVYKVSIGSPQHSYESRKGRESVHSFRTPAVLSGTAATDRAQLYTSLVEKINAYTNNWVTAYTLTYAAYTLGTSAGDAATNFTIGEVVTQETSTATARVAKCDITSGTMAADNAAGNIWLFNKSLTVAGGWLTTAKTLTGGTSAIVVTVTNATTVENTGIALEDNAGYFTSSLDREGKNQVFLNDAFLVDAVEYELAAVYSMGIGTTMYALQPVYRQDRQELISGKREFGFQEAPTAGKTYRKYVITYEGVYQDTNGRVESFDRVLVLYVDESNSTNLTNFNTALDTALAK